MFISKIILLNLEVNNMSEVELTKLSSKGQIVIPLDVREELDLKEGATFAVMAKNDTILLKKIEMPSKKEAFEKLHAWGVKFAKAKGIKEENLQAAINKNKGR